MNNIKLSENLLTIADKTTNLYEKTPEQYKAILTNKVRKNLPRSRTKYLT